MKRLAKRLLIIAVMTSCVVICIGLYFIFNPRKHISDPSVARTNWLAAFEKAIGPTPAPTNPPPDVFASLKTDTNDSTQFSLKFADRYRSTDLAGAGLGMVDANQRIQVETGEISLKYIAFGWDIVRTNFDYAAHLPGKFYELPAMKLIPAADVKPALSDWDQLLDFRGKFPAARFYFNVTNLTNFLVLGLEMYDARTYSKMQDGYSSSQTAERFYFETAFRRWHAGTNLLLLHLAHGEPQIWTVPFIPGSEHFLSNSAVKIAAFVTNSTSFSTRNDGTTTTLTLRSANSGRSESTVVLLEWPSTSNSPRKIELLDDAGQLFPNSGGGSSGMVRTIRTTGTNQPTSVRITCYPKITRYLFTIPTLPGLPPENDQITNLLETHVPFLRIEAGWDFETAVESLLQLDVPSVAPNAFPPGYFPIVFTNTTTASILEEYLRRSGQGTTLKYNNAAGTAEFIDPPFIQVWKKIKKVLQK